MKATTFTIKTDTSVEDSRNIRLTLNWMSGNTIVNQSSLPLLSMEDLKELQSTLNAYLG